MGKKGKVGKNRQDKFYHLAKEQGFRSRASFKLVQLNKRHNFLSSAARGVIDLCAAPGGWMQVARKHMPVHAPCVGIDLVPIKPVPGCEGLQGDITSDTTRSELRRALRRLGGEDMVDVVMNDGSPNMGKAWLHDAYTQSELTLAALKLASEFLAPGGTFVTKVFRSNDYNSLLFVMNQLFTRVNATKPSASRAESAEIYVMCLGYKAPKTVDPRLLNPKFVFKDMTDSKEQTKDADSKQPDLFLNTVMKEMKKRKRHRGGYEDGDLTLFKKISILTYCESPRPVALMTDSSQFSFEPHVMAQEDDISIENAKRVANALEKMEDTTSEVLSCCEDLKVLARREFKLLLKWRSAARSTLQQLGLLGKDARESIPEEQSEHSDAEEENIEETKMDESSNSEDSDDMENIDEELQSAKAELLAKEKRKKRKANKVRSATQRKIDMKIILPEASEDIGTGPADGLFSLKAATRVKNSGVNVTNVPVDVGHEADDEHEDDEDEQPVARLPYRVGDLEKEWDEDQAEIEKDLDRWYKVYLSRKKRDKNGVLLEESKERKRLTKRRALREAAEKGNTGEENKPAPELVIDSSETESDDDFDDEPQRLPKKLKNSREAALWFSQPLFRGFTGFSSSDDSDGNNEPDRKDGDIKGDDDDYETDDSDENIHRAARAEARKMADKARKEKDLKEDDIEIVPMDKRGGATNPEDDEMDSDSSFHSSDYDTDEKAEMVAIGRRMRESKKESQNVLDEAYNRYTFDDPFDLPRWFADPDPIYRQRQPPVTKEQVAEMKEYIKSLEAAPTKKEAEAKARKKARLTKKLEAMKTKANSVAEQADVPASSRMKAIEDIYKQAMKSGKSSKKGKPKQYQVIRPNGKMTVGKNAPRGRKALRGVQTKLVDKRLKADKRGLAKAAKKNKKKASRK